MTHPDFSQFIDTFGDATSRVPVPEDVIVQYQGILPDFLLDVWREEGWCAYADGLVWTVDPREFEDTVTDWVAESGFEDIDRYHAFARSAFGDLYVYGERTGVNLTIACSTHDLLADVDDLDEKSPEAREETMAAFFASADYDRFDLEDENDEPMFERALETLGPLAADQVYAFEPAIALGGDVLVESLNKVRLDVYLAILREMADPDSPLLDDDEDDDDDEDEEDEEWRDR
ncbi:hypothetical protein RAN3_3996 [plant metagenome]|uniref:GAD-like domain protein n=1 Tax=plant metagenome TaxID=1297885 RepID=A0A484VF60_9ZZZZ